MILNFRINKQILSYIGRNNIVAGSDNYLSAKFEFINDDWGNVERFAQFVKGDYTGIFKLDEDFTCAVPWEVVNVRGEFTVTVYATDTNNTKHITANSITIEVLPNGRDEIQSNYPTQDYISGLLLRVVEVDNKLKEAKEQNNKALDTLTTYNAKVSNDIAHIDQQATLAQTCANKAENLVVSLPSSFTDFMAHTVGSQGYKFTVYTTFSDLGLDYRTATPIDVIKALPNYSIWLCDLNTNCDKSWYDRTNGTRECMVKIYKVNSKICTLYMWEYRHSTPALNKTYPFRVLTANYYSNDNGETYTFSGYEPIIQRKQGAVRNDERAARELVEVAESYRGIVWKYGKAPQRVNDDDTASTSLYENGYPIIDCATLVNLALRGIKYKYSPYTNNQKKWRNQKTYSWAIENTSFGWMYIDYIIANGWEIEAGDNYKNLQAGDLVFWSINPRIESGFEANQYNIRQWGHVGIYTGRWVTEYENALANNNKYIARENNKWVEKTYTSTELAALDNTTKHPQTIEVAYVNAPSTEVVRYRFVDETASEDITNITAHDEQYLCMFARIPLRTKGSFTNANNIDNPLGIIHTSRFNNSFDVEIEGDGNDFSILINNSNTNVKLGYLSSGTFVPSTGSSARVVTNMIPKDYGLTNVPSGVNFYYAFYYDKRGNYLSTSNSDNAVYKRMSYRHSDNSQATADDLALFESNRTYFSKQVDSVYYGAYENAPEEPIFISGKLTRGEKAYINTKTGDIVLTNSSDTVTITGDVTKYAGNKYVYVYGGVAVNMYWDN